MLSGIKLKTKVLGLILLLGALSPIAAAFTSFQLKEQAAAETLAMDTKSGQTYLERINGLVYAIVMDPAASICLRIGIAPKNTATEF